MERQRLLNDQITALCLLVNSKSNTESTNPPILFHSNHFTLWLAQSPSLPFIIFIFILPRFRTQARGKKVRNKFNKFNTLTGRMFRINKIKWIFHCVYILGDWTVSYDTRNASNTRQCKYCVVCVYILRNVYIWINRKYRFVNTRRQSKFLSTPAPIEQRNRHVFIMCIFI